MLEGGFWQRSSKGVRENTGEMAWKIGGQEMEIRHIAYRSIYRPIGKGSCMVCLIRLCVVFTIFRLVAYISAGSTCSNSLGWVDNQSVKQLRISH